MNKLNEYHVKLVEALHRLNLENQLRLESDKKLHILENYIKDLFQILDNNTSIELNSECCELMSEIEKIIDE